MNRNYFALGQEQKTLDFKKGPLEQMQYSAPQLADTDARKVKGSFFVHR